jgi:hypothetical protein
MLCTPRFYYFYVKHANVAMQRNGQARIKTDNQQIVARETAARKADLL